MGLVTAVRQRDTSVFDALRREIEKSRAKTVIISCENMLFPLNEDRETLIARLFADLPPFTDIQCVACVRRADRHADSFYKEIVTNGRRMGSRTASEFLIDAQDALTDLAALFEPFEARSDGPVKLLDFDAQVDEDTLWPAFCDLIGLATPPATLDVPRYPSADRQLVETARLVNTMVPDQAQRGAILSDLFRALPNSADAQPVLSPLQRRDMIDLFHDRSSDFAAQRGYAPDYAAQRADVSDEWTPLAGLDQRYIETLSQARLRAERPVSMPFPTQGAVRNTKQVAPPQQPGFTIRPRPWAMRLLRMLPMFKS
jgi:hypothetical protein